MGGKNGGSVWWVGMGVVAKGYAQITGLSEVMMLIVNMHLEIAYILFFV